MKPLILSFFAVILFYSIFLDKNEQTQQTTIEPIPPTQAKQMKSSDLQPNTDSLYFYANKRHSLY
ncbi:hypothetical protein M2135_002193 [Parabacteroides sp. PF5-9]|nr:hypothetical protein [Parabacteroides sp. PF5-9]